MYDYDANTILIHPLKIRQASKITPTRSTFHHLWHRDISKHFVFDNEFSNTLKKTFLKKKVTSRSAPPHTHLPNVSEHTIQING